MAEPRVAFVIAGVQKAGTTALFDYLSEAPELSLSHVKETHFFDDDDQDWDAPDYAPYHALFDAPDGRLRGEATPIYLYWPGALERMGAYNPAMRLIVVLRDPVARAWSHWRMEYARGFERAPFAWCVREGRRRLFDAEPWGHHRAFSYVERGFYGEQIERLFAVFPREQTLVLTAEALQAEPSATLATVRAFLGLPAATGTVAARTVHAGREMDYGSELTPGDTAFLRQVYARDQERLAGLTGIRFG
jgi:hypothetical protein